MLPIGITQPDQWIQSQQEALATQQLFPSKPYRGSIYLPSICSCTSAELDPWDSFDFQEYLRL